MILTLKNHAVLEGDSKLPQGELHDFEEKFVHFYNRFRFS